MWSRFKKRFFGGSRKTVDDSSSLDETVVHACILTDAEDVRKSRQTLKQFAKDDLHAVAGDKKSGQSDAGSGGKLKRKLSWFSAGGKSSQQRRTAKSTTSLNSDKRRSGDDAAILATKTMTKTVLAETAASTIQTSTVQTPAASVVTSVGATSKSSSVVVDNVVRVTSSKTSSSLLDVDKSLLVSRDDVWCSRGGVEFTAVDKGTFGATCSSRIEELQRPVSLPVHATTDDAKSSPPKLKRRAKVASQQPETETRRSRLSKSLPEPDPPSNTTGQQSTTTTTSEIAPVQLTTMSSVETTDASEHLKCRTKRVPPPVPTRKSSTTTVTGCSVMEHAPEALTVRTTLTATTSSGLDEGQLSPSPTRNSPDSGSDDTEGKESGYVTLDDLQAQLMRSSWSSDERDINDSTHSNTERAASVTGKYSSHSNNSFSICQLLQMRSEDLQLEDGRLYN